MVVQGGPNNKIIQIKPKNTYLIAEDENHPSNASYDQIRGTSDNLQPSLQEWQSLQSSEGSFNGAEVVSPFLNVQCD